MAHAKKHTRKGPSVRSVKCRVKPHKRATKSKPKWFTKFVETEMDKEHISRVKESLCERGNLIESDAESCSSSHSTI